MPRSTSTRSFVSTPTILLLVSTHWECRSLYTCASLLMKCHELQPMDGSCAAGLNDREKCVCVRVGVSFSAVRARPHASTSPEQASPRKSLLGTAQRPKSLRAPRRPRENTKRRGHVHQEKIIKQSSKKHQPFFPEFCNDVWNVCCIQGIPIKKPGSEIIMKSSKK